MLIDELPSLLRELTGIENHLSFLAVCVQAVRSVVDPTIWSNCMTTDRRKPGDLGHDAVKEDRKRHFNTLIGLSDQFGNYLTSAFSKNIAEGKKFDDVLKSVRRSLVETGMKMALARHCNPEAY